MRQITRIAQTNVSSEGRKRQDTNQKSPIKVRRIGLLVVSYIDLREVLFDH